MENIQSEVNICMITDDNYIMPTSVAIHSMILNKSSEKYNFYIITSNLSKDSEEHFKSFEKENVAINIIREDAETRFKGLHSFEVDSICVASISALLKFILPDLLPDLDKVLYLDGDLVVETDLSEVYNIDLGDNYAATVLDTSKMYWKSSFNSVVDYYFNSGVMLLNLKKMRENNTMQELIETKRNLTDSSLMDQNVFNIVFDGKTVILPVKYNFQALGLDRAGSKWGPDDIYKYFKTRYNNKSEIFNDAKIIHYASKNKPWKEPNAAFAYKWTHYYLDLYGEEKPERKEKYGISVIIPCYNSEKYLQKTVDSVLSQTFSDFEIILIDCGSTDGTEKLIRSLADGQNNISAYFLSDGDLNSAKNLGIQKASGKYIHFIQCGDTIEKDCYKTVYSISEDCSLDCLLFEGKAVFEGNPTKKEISQYESLYSRTNVFPKIYNGEDLFVELRSSIGIINDQEMQLAKRDFLLENNISFKEHVITDDVIYTYKLITLAKSVIVLPKAFYNKLIRKKNEPTVEENQRAIEELTKTVLWLLNDYNNKGNNTDLETAVFNQIVSVCKNIRQRFLNIHPEYKKGEKKLAELKGIDLNVIFCIFLSNAGTRSAMRRFTTVSYSDANFKLNKANRQKSEIKEKLQTAYTEKSQINAKLQKTYKEKSAKTQQIKQLERWSAYPLLRKFKRLFKKAGK